MQWLLGFKTIEVKGQNVSGYRIYSSCLYRLRFERNNVNMDWGLNGLGVKYINDYRDMIYMIRNSKCRI